MIARYVRVSTLNQKIERQLRNQHEGEMLYIDKVSGSTPFIKRAAGFSLMSDVIVGNVDKIIVSSIDRLGRNALDILQTIDQLHQYKVCIKVENLGIESWANGKEHLTFKLIVSVLANISEMERESMLERQKEGIAIAKAKGIYKGREKNTSESRDKFLGKYPQVIQHLKKDRNTILEIAKLCDCSKNTVMKIKKLLN